jgi:hypothetical protein
MAWVAASGQRVHDKIIEAVPNTNALSPAISEPVHETAAE